MRLKLFNIFLLFGLLLISSSVKHPLKLTASLIEYNPKTNSLRMECKVFIDDFEETINRKGFSVSNMTAENQNEIEFFFNLFYRITINGQKLPLVYESSEVNEGFNVFIVKFAENNITIKEGDVLIVQNKLFFDRFGKKQTNRITLRIPPFVFEKYYETTLGKYSISHNF